MFESPKRAFSRGATHRDLPLIDPAEFSSYLVALAEASGVKWSHEIADSIIDTAESHTYSVTAIAHALFEASLSEVFTWKIRNLFLLKSCSRGIRLC